jgi:cysteine-rich repeat protein
LKTLADVNADGCANAYALPRCGDGFVQTGEVCDDGNSDDSDGCLKNCVKARCGDGVVRAGLETCDDGNRSDGY